VGISGPSGKGGGDLLGSGHLDGERLGEGGGDADIGDEQLPHVGGAREEKEAALGIGKGDREIGGEGALVYGARIAIQAGGHIDGHEQRIGWPSGGLPIAQAMEGRGAASRGRGFSISKEIGDTLHQIGEAAAQRAGCSGAQESVDYDARLLRQRSKLLPRGVVLGP